MSISVSEAGRKGGLAVLRRRGRSFYSEIGKKGQLVMRRKYPGMAKEWGRRGGRPRKLTLCQIMGEEKQVRITKEVTDPPELCLSPPTHHIPEQQDGSACDHSKSNRGES